MGPFIKIIITNGVVNAPDTAVSNKTVSQLMHCDIMNGWLFLACCCFRACCATITTQPSVISRLCKLGKWPTKQQLFISSAFSNWNIDMTIFFDFLNVKLRRSLHCRLANCKDETTNHSLARNFVTMSETLEKLLLLGFETFHEGTISDLFGVRSMQTLFYNKS